VGEELNTDLRLVVGERARLHLDRLAASQVAVGGSGKGLLAPGVAFGEHVVTHGAATSLWCLRRFALLLFAW
jgi:hypothetical protein